MHDDMREALRQLRPQDRSWAESAQGAQLLESVKEHYAEQGLRDDFTKGSRSIGWKSISLVAACSIICVALVAWNLGQSKTPGTPVAVSPNTESAPRQANSGRPVGYFFDSLEQLSANSPVIVKGIVVSTGRGESLGEDGNIYARDVEVSIQEVYRGSVPGNIVVHQGMYISDTGYEDPEQPWVRPSETVVLFLVPLSLSAGSHYVPSALPSVWRIQSDDRVETGAADQAARDVDGRPWEEVEPELRTAIEDASERSITPLPGGPRTPGEN